MSDSALRRALFSGGRGGEGGGGRERAPFNCGHSHIELRWRVRGLREVTASKGCALSDFVQHVASSMPWLGDRSSSSFEKGRRSE